MALNYLLQYLVPDPHEVIEFLVERHNYLQDQAWKAQKTRRVALDDSISIARNYREHIYFVFKLGEPALLRSKKIAYEYAFISRYPWHMKNRIKNFCEKHPGSTIILKMVNDPLRLWKKITASQCFNVIFVLTKDMIIFCWQMIKKLPRPDENIFFVILWNTADNF